MLRPRLLVRVLHAGWGVGELFRQADGECRAPAELALDDNVAPHHLAEMPA